MSKKTVAVDLDGVLAKYDGWDGLDNIGDPVPGARRFLQRLREEGYEVLIYTTRCNVAINAEDLSFRVKVVGVSSLRDKVQRWLDTHKMLYDRIHTGQGKPIAVSYVDDRAVQCRPQEAESSAFPFEDAIEAVKDLD